jgi:hypothetical protein
VACFEAIEQVLWQKNFILGLRVVDSISKPLLLYCDNQPTMFYSSNNKPSVSAKYIDIKYHIVKDRVYDQTIKIEHIGTGFILADPLTESCSRHGVTGHTTRKMKGEGEGPCLHMHASGPGCGSPPRGRTDRIVRRGSMRLPVCRRIIFAGVEAARVMPLSKRGFRDREALGQSAALQLMKRWSTGM